MLTDPEPCLELPSATSARKLAEGEASAFPTAVGHLVARAGIIGAGAYAAGVRGTALKRAAVGGSLAIEVFVLAMAARRR